MIRTAILATVQSMTEMGDSVTVQAIIQAAIRVTADRP